MSPSTGHAGDGVGRAGQPVVEDAEHVDVALRRAASSTIRSAWRVAPTMTMLGVRRPSRRQRRTIAHQAGVQHEQAGGAGTPTPGAMSRGRPSWPARRASTTPTAAPTATTEHDAGEVDDGRSRRPKRYSADGAQHAPGDAARRRHRQGSAHERRTPASTPRPSAWHGDDSDEPNRGDPRPSGGARGRRGGSHAAACRPLWRALERR